MLSQRRPPVSGSAGKSAASLNTRRWPGFCRPAAPRRLRLHRLQTRRPFGIGAPVARKTEADVRGRLVTAEEDLRKAREDVARYDDRSFNWRDPDAVEAAQRNFQGMDIRVRDPKTGQMGVCPVR